MAVWFGVTILGVAGPATGLVWAVAATGQWWMLAVAVLYAGAYGWMNSYTNRWVEVEGREVRFRRLFSGRVSRYPVSIVVGVDELAVSIPGPSRLDTGFRIRFSEGADVTLMHDDWDGLDGFAGELQRVLAARAAPAGAQPGLIRE